MTAVFVLALTLIGKYFIFEKMGMPGWKCLIPIYSDYLLFRELIGSGYFWGYIASALLACFCSALVTIGVVSGVMEFLFVIAAVAACTVTIAITDMRERRHDKKKIKKMRTKKESRGQLFFFIV